MERRHTFTRFSLRALPAGWSFRLVLLWICLLAVALTTAYALQMAAASMVSSVAADELDGSHQALDSHAIREQRGALVQAASMSSIRMVLITGEDATTGDRMQVECATTTDRYAEDALLVELKDLPDVAAGICNVANVPAVRP
jgi:hypothetical protein